MKATLDAEGRLLIPDDIRKLAGLQPGDEVEVRWCDGHIEIEPAYRPVDLVPKGHLLVAVPRVPVPPCTKDIVTIIDEFREEMDRERSGLESW